MNAYERLIELIEDSKRHETRERFEKLLKAAKAKLEEEQSEIDGPTNIGEAPASRWKGNH